MDASTDPPSSPQDNETWSSPETHSHDDSDDESEDLEARTLAAMQSVHSMMRQALAEREQKSKIENAGTRAKHKSRNQDKSTYDYTDPYDSQQEEDDSMSEDYGSDCDYEEEEESEDSDGDNEEDGQDSSDEDHSGSDTVEETRSSRYSLSKYRIKPKSELKSDDKDALLDHLLELNKFLKVSSKKFTRKQLLNCIIQLEDYLYEAKKKSGASISMQEKIDAEDTSDIDDDNIVSDQAKLLKGLRAATKAMTKSRTRVLTKIPKIESLLYDPNGRLIAPSHYAKLPRNVISLKNLKKGDPADAGRSFGKEDMMSDEGYLAQLEGRLLFIDPEVRFALEYLKSEAKKDWEENQEYVKGVKYHPDDLKMITIDTLPSNGRQKPTHSGPQEAAYYQNYALNLFASIRTWIERYILPPPYRSINLNDPDIPSTFRSAAQILSFYFKSEDFLGDHKPVLGDAAQKSMLEARQTKRLAFFMYIFHQILYSQIFGQWLYGFDERTADKVMEWGGLKGGIKNSEKGHEARSLWFVEKVRRRETNMTQKMIRHQVVLATCYRQTFVPLLKFKKRNSKGKRRRIGASGERELHMIISDAQALQLMFQSEFCYHKVQFDQPNLGFEPGWMINTTEDKMLGMGDKMMMPRLDRDARRAGLGFSFEPAVFVSDGVRVWAKAVY